MTRRFFYHDGRWHNFEERVAYLRTLGSDWDSYGGRPADADAIRRARRFLEIVRPALEPMVFLLASGGICLNFEYGDDMEAVGVTFEATEADDSVYVEMDPPSGAGGVA